MQIKTFEFNPLGVNTYVLSDETNECVVIDAAAYYENEKKELVEYIIHKGLKVKHLLNTHLHFDHFLGANLITAQFGVSIQCHPDDLFLLDSVGNQMQLFGIKREEGDQNPKIGGYLHDGDEVTFGNQTLKVFHTPGHSPGSVVFYNEKEGCVFTGDLLFYTGVGRTDLMRGNYNDLVHSIESKIFVLPDSTIAYPGHGPTTSIGFEKENNPFVGK